MTNTFTYSLLSIVSAETEFKNCKINYTEGKCDHITLIISFVLSILFLIPFFYMISSTIRRSSLFSGVINKPIVCYCIIYSAQTIFFAIYNFLFMFNLLFEYLGVMYKHVLFYKMFFISSYVCFFASIAKVTLVLPNIFVKILYYGAQVFFYIIILCCVIFYFDIYIPFTAPIDAKFLPLWKTIAYAFEDIMMSFSIVVLSICFILSKIQDYFHPDIRKKMKILIFLLCLAHFISKVVTNIVSGVIFRTITNTIGTYLLPPLYIIGGYSTKLIILWMMSVISKPNYSPNDEGAPDIDDINRPLDFEF